MVYVAGSLKSLGAGLGVSLLLGAAAACADDLADAVAALPPAVEEVRVGGLWTEGDRSGTYRVIVARSGERAITARLFVQWIAHDGGGKVDHSIEITELGALAVDLTGVSAEPSDDGLALYIDTLAADGTEQLYELFVQSPEEYRFGPASN